MSQYRVEETWPEMSKAMEQLNLWDQAGWEFVGWFYSPEYAQCNQTVPYAILRKK